MNLTYIQKRNILFAKSTLVIIGAVLTLILVV